MKLSKTTWWMVGGLGVSVISIGGFMLFNKRLKQKKGSTTINGASSQGKGISIGTRGATKQVPNWDNAFDMNYTNDVKQWLSPKTILVLDQQSAKQFAKKIKEAKGFFDDDEAAIRDIFSKRLKDKTNVSSISRAFWELYKKDMWQHLASFLSPSEMKKYVNQYVKSLPNYTSA